MTSEEDVYNALKYRVVVEPNGTRKYFNAAGQLQHDEGPAVYWSYGLKEWWQNGLRHRTDGPAAVYSDGAAEWWLYGVAYSHRLSGAACTNGAYNMHTEETLYNALKYRIVVDTVTGTRRYYNALGQLHRDDGPAVEYVYGHAEWWQHDLRHRVNGPAVVFSDGRKYWFLNGVQYTEVDYHAAIEHLGLQHDH